MRCVSLNSGCTCGVRRCPGAGSGHHLVGLIGHPFVQGVERCTYLATPCSAMFAPRFDYQHVLHDKIQETVYGLGARGVTMQFLVDKLHVLQSVSVSLSLES